MHPGELNVTPALVAALVADQFPQLAGMSVEPLPGPGTVNAIFRIGGNLAARFPLEEGDVAAARNRLGAEATASAEFAAVVPLAAPRPVGIGRAGLGYPMPWSVQTWVPGQTAQARATEDRDVLARDVAKLLRRLRTVNTRGRSFSGRGRGGSLQTHDAWIEHCLVKSEKLIDTGRARDVWARFRQLPDPPRLVMSHTDLIPANLLVDEGRLIGVLDTGGFAPADPALDLVVAWHLFDARRRRVIRDELASDATEWARGAAWAFQQAVGLIWYYEESNPSMSELGLSTLDRILSSSFE